MKCVCRLLNDVCVRVIQIQKNSFFSNNNSENLKIRNIGVNIWFKRLTRRIKR